MGVTAFTGSEKFVNLVNGDVYHLLGNDISQIYQPSTKFGGAGKMLNWPDGERCGVVD